MIGGAGDKAGGITNAAAAMMSPSSDLQGFKEAVGMMATGRRNFYDKIKEVTYTIFESITKKNGVGYDITELNLEENIRHSFSDLDDILSLTSGEMSSYKQLFIDMYRNRQIYEPFLSNDENFIDPLRVVKD